MTTASLTSLLRHLRRVAAPTVEQRSDGELLREFLSQRDEASFAALLRRHGAPVLRVCRHVLGHEQDAEDAFQATFLVLAQKAASIRKEASLASYLHGVAYRLSLRAKRDATRRRWHERHVPPRAAHVDAVDPSWREVQAIVEEEIARLPEKWRAPFLLCQVQGLGRAEAARQLRIKEGTVWSRLSAARARLQKRLTQRGIALTAALAALAIAEKTVRVSLDDAVVQAARQTAMGSLASVSARVAMLAQTGAQTMTGKATMAMSLVALLIAGAGSLVCHHLTAQSPQTPSAQRAKIAVASKKPQAPRVRTDRYGDPLPHGAIARLGTVRWRHGFLIYALAYSPDGKKIAATGVGRALTLWDSTTGKEIHQFPNDYSPMCVAFSPDGKILAAPGRNQTARLWDVATGKELRQLKGQHWTIFGLAFSPDGQFLATSSTDGSVFLWDPNTGAEKRRIESGQGGLYRLAISPDSKLLAAGGADGTIRLWDTAKGTERGRWQEHKKSIYHIAFSPDGKWLASSSEDGAVLVWDRATGRQVRDLGDKMEGWSLPIAFSPEGALLATGRPDGTIRLYDATSGEEKRRWRAGVLAVRTLAFSPDGKTLAAGVTWDGSIRQWDVATGKERQPFAEHHGLIDKLRFAADKQTLISIGRARRVLWWDVAANRPKREFTWSAKRYSGAALSPDGNFLAVSGWPDSLLRLWDVRTGKAGIGVGKPQKEVFWAIAFSPDGRLIAAERGKEILVWRLSDGKEIQRMESSADGSRCLCFSPDGKWLACGTYIENAPSLRLWDVASGKERCSFADRGPIEGLAFSPDGKMLAAGQGHLGGEHESMVRLWDTATGQELSRHTGHREGVSAVAFSPDGKLVVSGAGSTGFKDSSVHVWEAATGRLIRRFEGHHSCVGSVTFTPDGLAVASGGGDSAILLWDITGRRIDGRGHAKALTPRELEACWHDLADADAAKAYDAVWALVAAPERAIPFLQKHLHPVPRPDAKTVARLLAGLESDEFAVRRKANEELSEFGDAIAPELRKALANKPPLEVRRRVQQLLDQARDWTGQRLRDRRAIQALEHLNARRLLEALAAGTPDALRTEEAKAALRRIGN